MIEVGIIVAFVICASVWLGYSHGRNVGKEEGRNEAYSNIRIAQNRF
jgi:hypothetical protein